MYQCLLFCDSCWLSSSTSMLLPLQDLPWPVGCPPSLLTCTALIWCGCRKQKNCTSLWVCKILTNVLCVVEFVNLYVTCECCLDLTIVPWVLETTNYTDCGTTIHWIHPAVTQALPVVNWKLCNLHGSVSMCTEHAAVSVTLWVTCLNTEEGLSDWNMLLHIYYMLHTVLDLCECFPQFRLVPNSAVTNKQMLKETLVHT